jgi:hypothetical protein
MAYATLAELKAEIDVEGTGDDATLQRLLDAAENAINSKCNRPDGFVAVDTATPRYYPGSGKAYQYIGECVEVTAVAVKDSPSDDEDEYESWVVGTPGVTANADVFPAFGDPEWPDYNRTPYDMLIIGTNSQNAPAIFTSGRYSYTGGFPRSSQPRKYGVLTVRVTAKWGFATVVPTDIKEATIMMAARVYKQLQSTMSDTIAAPEFGELMFRRGMHPTVDWILHEGRYIQPASRLGT